MNNYRIVATTPDGMVLDIAEGGIFHVAGFAATAIEPHLRENDSVVLTVTRIISANESKPAMPQSESGDA